MHSYQIAQPLATHYREATCQEVECPAHVEGWVTILDPSLPAHGGLFKLLRNSGRRYQEMSSEDACQLTGESFPSGLRAFVFPPGQQCFEQHHVPVGRDPIFLHRRPGGNVLRHREGRAFNEDFNESAFRAERFIRG